MTTTLVTMLSCGQGAMTLVEIYEDLKKPAAFLALIDCGSDDIRNRTKTAGAIAYVTSKVKARNQPVLDLVIISHQDKDHVNLLPALGAQLSALQATVTKIHCCGLNWDKDPKKRKKSKSSVERFVKYVGYQDSPAYDLPTHSDYTTVPPTSFARYDNKVFFRFLIENMPETAEGTNRSSGVVVVEDVTTPGEPMIAVLPGDITRQTMAYIRDKAGIKGLGPNKPLTKVVALAAPHHGARATAVASPGQDWDDFDWFARSMKPDHLGVSAGPGSKYKHPVFAVIERFTGTVQNVRVVANAAWHSYATFDETSETWQNKVTADGIWSTVCSYTKPPKNKKGNAPPAGKKSKPTPTETRDLVIKLNAALTREKRVGLRPTTPSASSVVRDLVLLAPAP